MMTNARPASERPKSGSLRLCMAAAMALWACGDEGSQADPNDVIPFPVADTVVVVDSAGPADAPPSQDAPLSEDLALPGDTPTSDATPADVSDGDETSAPDAPVVTDAGVDAEETSGGDVEETSGGDAEQEVADATEPPCEPTCDGNVCGDDG